MQGREYDSTDPNTANDLPKIGSDGNVVGMITPDQYRAIEESRLAQAQTAPQPVPMQAPTQVPPQSPTPAPTSPTPQPQLPPQPPPTGTGAQDSDITVGGVTKKQSEWYNEMEATYNIDTSLLPAESRQAMLEGYIAKSHDKAWKASNTQKAEEISRQRRVQGDITREIEMKQRVLSDTLNRLTAEEQRLTTIAAKTMSEQEIYREDGTLDPQKFMEYQQIGQAKFRLTEIEGDRSRVQNEAAQTAIDRTIAEAENLMAQHPEIAMTESLSAVIEKVDRHGQRDHPDVHKLLDIYDIVEYAKKMNITLEMAFQRKAATGSLLSVRGTAPAQPTQITVTVPSTPSAERVAASVSGKQDGAQFLDGKGTLPTRPQVAPRRSVADNIRDASQRAAAGKGNPALEKLGY
jgi:hypothetical protein